MTTGRASGSSAVRWVALGAFLVAVLGGSWLTARWILQEEPRAVVAVPSPAASSASPSPSPSPSQSSAGLTPAPSASSQPSPTPAADEGSAIPPQARVLFAGSSMSLSGVAKSDLDRIAAHVKRSPSRFVVVLSHWDNRGSTGNRYRTAMNRAHVVQAYLLAHGVAKNRLSHTTFSDALPAGAGAALGAGSGRVEVVVRDLGGLP